MKPFRHWVSVCLLLPALCAAQTFRSEVHLVNVGFSVRDAAGKLNPNLTQDDFEILEDGVPQKIAFFARSVDVPLNLGLVVDISGSQASFVKSHQKDLRTFLDEVLRHGGPAFLVNFANHPRLVVNYTANGRELVNALEGYQWARDKSVYPMLGPMEIRTGGTAFYDAIYHAANQMFQNTDNGRRALVVFSDGEENTSAHHMMNAIEIAQTQVLLFCIRYTELHGRWTAKNKYGKSVMERLGGNRRRRLRRSGKRPLRAFPGYPRTAPLLLRTGLSLQQFRRRRDLPQDHHPRETAQHDRPLEDRILPKVSGARTGAAARNP